MEVLYILVPLSLVLVAIAAAVFLVMSKNDQFEDLDRPAHDILMDDDHPPRSLRSSGEMV